MNGPQPFETITRLCPAEEAHYSTYTSQRRLVARGALAFERSQPYFFSYKDNFGNSANTISIACLAQLSLIGISTDAIINSETYNRGPVRADDSQSLLLFGR